MNAELFRGPVLQIIDFQAELVSPIILVFFLPRILRDFPKCLSFFIATRCFPPHGQRICSLEKNEYFPWEHVDTAVRGSGNPGIMINALTAKRETVFASCRTELGLYKPVSAYI